MFPSDPTFNEMHIREHQMRLSAVTLWLKDLAEEQEPKMANEIINQLIELIEVDSILSYFINYERSCNMMLNKAKLENAKLKLKNQQLNDTLKGYEEALNQIGENL